MLSDLRELTAYLEKSGRLLHIKKRVSSEYEAAALIKQTGGRQPMIFEHIDNYSYPLITGLGGTREILSDSMGMAPEDLVPRIASAIVNPIPVRRVEKAPVHENVILAPFDLSRYFPILKYNEFDSGRYMVSGVMTARDITGKRLYTSIRRMQYLGGNRSNILITSYEMKEQLRYCEELKKPMDIAVMFGVVPAVILGSQISTQYYHANKLDVSGALLGAPLDIVRCKTVDVDVLANAEVVLEGKLMPWIKAEEGPFGEMAGYYGIRSAQPVVELTALTFRNNPMFQTIFPSSMEEKLPMSLVREVALISSIRQTVPNVTAVHVTLGGVGRYHAVIQIKKVSHGDGKQAVLAAFSADKDLKMAVAVDQDVDIFNHEEVEWAIATRMQADMDVFIVPGTAGSPLEPSHNLRGVTAKMGIDATCPLGRSEFKRTHIPGYEKINIRDYI